MLSPLVAIVLAASLVDASPARLTEPGGLAIPMTRRDSQIAPEGVVNRDVLGRMLHKAIKCAPVF
jgi:hypothetical protein